MILPIQYLRGFAAFMVLLHHVAFKLERFGSNPLGWLHAGDVGVDVFFVISGFVMCHSVRDRHGSADSAFDFLRGRVARVIPLYWLLTTVALGVFLVAPRLVNSSGGQTEILNSYLLLPTLGKYLIQNGWTLGYEFYFYLLFAVGVLLPRRVGIALVLGALALLVACGVVWAPTDAWGSFLTNQLLAEFAFGMLLYLAYERGVAVSNGVACGIAGVAVVGWGIVNIGHVTGSRVIDYGLPALLLSFAAVCRRSDGTPKPHRVLAWLGDSSYSLYLVHPFVVAAITVLAAPAVRYGAPSVVVGVAMVAASLLVGGLLYAKVERPLVRIARRLLHHGH